MQVIYKHANAPLPELTPDLKRFESIVVNCIAKIPARRYPSAEQLVDVPITRILLPTTGADPESRAPEIAFAIATGATLHIEVLWSVLAIVMP